VLSDTSCNKDGECGGREDSDTDVLVLLTFFLGRMIKWRC